MNIQIKADPSGWLNEKSPAYKAALVQGVKDATDVGARILQSRIKKVTPRRRGMVFRSVGRGRARQRVQARGGQLQRAIRRKRVSPFAVVVYLDMRTGFYGRFLHNGVRSKGGGLRIQPNPWFANTVRDSGPALERLMGDIVVQRLQGVTTARQLKPHQRALELLEFGGPS